MFWKMFAGMSNQDRQLFLKFMCGRSRLEPGTVQEIVFTRQHGDGGENASLPIGHTCGNTMDIPVYKTLELMTKKVLIAIRLCGEVDADASYMDEDDEEERGLNTATVNMTSANQATIHEILPYTPTNHDSYRANDTYAEH